MEQKKSLISRYERVVEMSTWAVIILVLFGVRFLPQNPLNDYITYWMSGGILAFVLIYYMVIYRYFSKNNRLYLKSIADIILIGVLLHLLKDYGQFFFALYFLPIAAAALSLELVNALLIATLASLFVAFEFFLGAEGVIPAGQPIYEGFWQIAFIIFMTIFCRVLAQQLKQEQIVAEESKAQARLLEAENIHEKEFLSLTSHQLYTPTSIIRGFSSLLKNENLGKLTDEQKDAVEEIYNSSKRMTDLVSQLLSVSKAKSSILVIDPEPTDLKPLLENIVKQMQLIKKCSEQSLKLIVPENLEKVSIDEARIRGVVTNLIDNAIKYCPKGEITVEVAQDSSQTKISVNDTGVGLKNEDFEKLFQPFFRGKNILELDNKGTGLGLYISKLIIEGHGGKIWAEHNTNNHGSKFIFAIPNQLQKKELNENSHC